MVLPLASESRGSGVNREGGSVATQLTIKLTSPVRRRGRPNDLKGVIAGGCKITHGRPVLGAGGSHSGFIRPRPGQIHDRKSQDALLNAQLVAVEIDDPLALNLGDKIIVLRSTRNDPLSDMMARHHIEHHHYMAGRHWQNAHENSQIGTVRAIDPSKTTVDGGRPPEMLTDQQRRGADDINAVALKLKQFGNALVCDVLAEGLTIRLAARKRGMVADREKRALGAHFRVCLQIMAEMFGLAMKEKA